MARIELARGIGEDFERIVEHFLRYEIADPAVRLEEILESIDVLKRSPLIGRLLEGDLREVIIGRGSRGYVALYRYVAESNVVFVLAIRGQREAGYSRD
ncbi:MAG: type II toxin-antitoxin system RelE/ParE family toxin [Vicinamibacteria bacterium]